LDTLFLIYFLRPKSNANFASYFPFLTVHFLLNHALNSPSIRVQKLTIFPTTSPPLFLAAKDSVFKKCIVENFAFGIKRGGGENAFLSKNRVKIGIDL